MEVMVDIALVHKNNALPCLVCKANPAWGLDHGDVDKDLLAAERRGATKMKRGRGSGERHAVFFLTFTGTPTCNGGFHRELLFWADDGAAESQGDGYFFGDELQQVLR
ncbi:hypothetical protein Zm00014a_016547 [Zea mays]|uniref:Uncharacterized protein n=1 Tax=Zea mays TaxID=4577 RepID=A0A3L6FMC7_MAIZE|nr:hypothetical protein Zm00014a_016547 [Zea mays]